MHDAGIRATSHGVQFAARKVSLVVTVALVGCQDAGAIAGPAPMPTLALAAVAAPAHGEAIPEEYVVLFADDVSDVPGLAKQLAVQHGASVRFTYSSALKGFASHMSAQAAAALARHPRVASVEPDRTVPLAAVQATADWGLDRVDQRSRPLDSQFNYTSAGEGVSIYIIDSGIRLSHVDLEGRAVAGYTSVSDGLGAADCTGHGTHVAGIAGSRTHGVAKRARLVSVRVYDCNSIATMSGLLGGIEWITKNAPRPAVANMSLGGDYSATLNAAVQNSIAAGVTYVVSAGNYSKDACTVSPASVATAITVGASTSTDEQASFSDFGSCVDVYAPGIAIRSTYHTGDNATYVLGGTSMSAPFAAGVAALYLSAHPQATPAEVSLAITRSATPGALAKLGAGSPNLLLFSRFAADSTAPAPVTSPTAAPATATDAPPVAALSVSCARARCTLDGTASSDDRGIVAYAWDFGDGSPVVTGAMARLTRTYESVGSFAVTLTVTDVSGQNSRVRRTVTIKRL
jgi:subtilisin family serine protease